MESTLSSAKANISAGFRLFDRHVTPRRRHSCDDITRQVSTIHQFFGTPSLMSSCEIPEIKAKTKLMIDVEPKGM
jgi:hypothetical protein